MIKELKNFERVEMIERMKIIEDKMKKERAISEVIDEKEK